MFKDPIAPRVKPDEKKNPWDFTAPCYDHRTMVSAGDSYGMGFKSPIGRKGPAKLDADTLPFGRVDTMRTDNIPETPMKMYGKKKEY
jgi:hypothetical protein